MRESYDQTIFTFINYSYTKNAISDEFPAIFGCFCEGGLLTGK